MEARVNNFFSLKAEFHDKGKAIRGFKNIENFMVQNQPDELKHFLRFHVPTKVVGDELIARFEVDALIEYYNLLLVAIFAGYVPGKLDDESRSEILSMLDHPSVKPYYEENYVYKMVSYVVQYAKQDRIYQQEGNQVTIRAFNEFISINRKLKRDKDLQRFLGMLDHVWYGTDTIHHVNEILASENKLIETFTTKHKTEAQCAVWGFIKYTTIIGEFKTLLQSINEYPLLQSAFWMFHGYFFDRMNIKMKEIFEEAFQNLENALSNPEIFKNIIQEIYGANVPLEIDETQLKDFAFSAINQAREDVEFVLNPTWGDAFIAYFEG